MNARPASSTAEQIPILDYAPARPPGRVRKWIVLLVAGALGEAAGAAIAAVLTPRSYHAVGYLTATAPNAFIGFGVDNAERWEKWREGKHTLFARITSEVQLNLLITDLIATGVSRARAVRLATQVHYHDIPESRLIRVSLTDWSRANNTGGKCCLAGGLRSGERR